MKTAVDRIYEYGFVIDEQEMRRIHNLALQQMKRVAQEEEITEKYEVTYHNDLVTEKTCFDQIFSESNGGQWEIQNLIIDLGTKINDASLQLTQPRIRLSFKKGYCPIKMYIACGDRDWVYLTSSQLEDRIAKIKRTDFWNAQIWGFVSSVFMIMCVVFAVISFLRLSPAGRTFSILLAIFSGLIASSPFAIPYFYPRYNFCWGDYLDTFNRRKNLGNLLLLSILGTLVLGIVSSVIASLLTGGFNI